jgi:hypothetical protein
MLSSATKKKTNENVKREAEDSVGWTPDLEAESRISTLENGDPIEPSIRPQVLKLYSQFVASMPNEQSDGDSKILHQAITNNYLQFREDALKLIGEEAVNRIFGSEQEVMQFYVSVQKDLSVLNAK